MRERGIVRKILFKTATDYLKLLTYIIFFRFKRSVKNCYKRDCDDEAVELSDYCIKHILSGEKEQFLIRHCCFLHADGQQCRVPVYDVLATVAVCNDHLNAVIFSFIFKISTHLINFNFF